MTEGTLRELLRLLAKYTEKMDLPQLVGLDQDLRFLADEVGVIRFKLWREDDRLVMDVEDRK